MNASSRASWWDRMAPFLALIPLYLAFVALLIASGATKENTLYTCATTEDEKNSLTVSEQLAIAYKVCYNQSQH